MSTDAILSGLCQLSRSLLAELDNTLDELRPDPGDGQELDGDLAEFLEEVSKGLMTRLVTALSVALERIAGQSTQASFMGEWNKYAQDPTAFETEPYNGESYCPARELLDRYVTVLSAATGYHRSELETRRLQRILEATAQIVRERQVEPSKEKEVKDCVFHVLKHAFVDAIGEFSIPHTFHAYKPDMGVRSLKSAIEYKFVDSLEDLKKSIGAIFEDMKGYRGSLDWTCFYSVIYMTDAFATLEQLRREFALSAVDSRWTPILVTGKGGRRRRRATQNGIVDVSEIPPS